MTSKRWQDWVLIIGGVWLFVAPWALGTSSDVNSSWNAWTVGVLVAGTGWWSLTKPADKTSEWLQGLFGVWLFVAPWVLGFSALTAASANAWIVGASIVGLAWWDIAVLASAPAMRSGSSEDHLAHGSH